MNNEQIDKVVLEVSYSNAKVCAFNHEYCVKRYGHDSKDAVMSMDTYRSVCQELINDQIKNGVEPMSLDDTMNFYLLVENNPPLKGVETLRSKYH